MRPPAIPSGVSAALDRCPFLHAVSELQGEDVASRLALNPLASVSNHRSQPIFPEDAMASVNAVFNLFHGRNGAIPLNKPEQRPFSKPSSIPKPYPSDPAAATEKLQACPVSHLPTASISLANFGFPNPGDFFRRRPNNNNHQRKPQSNKNNGGNNSNKHHRKPNRPSTAHGKASAAASPTADAINPSNPSHSQAQGGGGQAGRCPMRRVFGPLGSLLPLVAANGRMHCPPAIVAMRAAIAGLKPVRQLRPQALPVRSVAMAGTAVIANVPCGMWREHTKKFSPEWFLAVHATIPFVAMLRKAVLMPPWAILLTVAGAIAGQSVGAGMERARLKSADTMNTTTSGMMTRSGSKRRVQGRVRMVDVGESYGFRGGVARNTFADVASVEQRTVVA